MIEQVPHIKRKRRGANNLFDHGSEDSLTPRELLINGAEQLGLALTIEQVNSLFIYLAELKKWNQKMNLTAIRDEQDIIIKHVLDSLSYLSGFDPARSQKLLDIGSGAGFPAIPIKITHPEIAITLVESIKKKAAFLRHIIRTLKLVGIEVIDKRVEQLSYSYQAAFDIVTARAFADMKFAITAGLPFLKPGGLIVLSRGPKEMLGTKGLEEYPITLDKRLEFSLPHSAYQRAIWVFKKTL
jgi:16S rRNA (guanine527-N7)-methyltransferase